MTSLLNRSTLAVIAVLVFASHADAKVMRVDCAKGESINRAIAKSAEDLVIEFSGVCAEDVLIDRGGVTLRGTGIDPKIVGAAGVPYADRLPAVLVIGAGNVVLSGFTVDDSDSRGIRARGAAALTIDGITAIDSSYGLLLDGGSSVLVRNSRFNDNMGDGIGVWDNSTLELEGTIEANRNTRAGIIVSGSSSAVVSTAGAHVTTNDNLYGIVLQLTASVLMTSAAPTSCTASGNQDYGLSVSAESHWSGTIAVSGSQYGVGVEWESSLWSAANRLSVSSCEIGLYVGQSSFASARSVALSANDYGVWVDDASADVGASSIHGSNYEDVHLEFGAHLRASGTSAGVVWCDGTVLTRGSVKCPSPAALAAPDGPLGSDSVPTPAERGPRAPFTIGD